MVVGNAFLISRFVDIISFRTFLFMCPFEMPICHSLHLSIRVIFAEVVLA